MWSNYRGGFRGAGTYGEGGSYGGGAYGASSNDVADSAYSFVGGGYDNHIVGDGNGDSVITGGVHSIISDSDSAFVGGGEDNYITSSFFAAVVGGYDNGISDNVHSTIGGGLSNAITGMSDFGINTIGGGSDNTIWTSDWCVIGGGHSNSITNGPYATVPGGYSNQANGFGSFAAGSVAKAEHTHSAVFGLVSDDTVTGECKSKDDNSMHICAPNGVHITTDSGGIELGQAIKDLQDKLQALEDRLDTCVSLPC